MSDVQPGPRPIVHPIERAWVTTGGTGAQNYDEFADESEITAIVAANPRSALGVEMPHRAPDSPAGAVADALPAARDRLVRAQRDGCYAPVTDVVVLYRIAGPGPGDAAYGMFCMVDTDQISASGDEPGLVIRNEDVFLDKVRERVALAEATGHLLSPVLLLRAAPGTDDPAGELHDALVAACRDAGAPAATDLDAAGRAHEIWPLPPGPTADRLCALAGTGELVVADGNHRSLAAQVGGLRRFLAVVTTSRSVTIQPYNRLVSELPFPADELPRRLAAAGCRVSAMPAADGRPEVPAAPGVVRLYMAGTGYAVEVPPDPAGSQVENLDHARVERVLLGGVLGLDPGDKRITYVGGDYPAGWLCDEVDAGRAELAVLIAPVPVADFVAVNLARQKMPRKSTWFTPKARAGLVLAQLR